MLPIPESRQEISSVKPRCCDAYVGQVGIAQVQCVNLRRMLKKRVKVLLLEISDVTKTFPGPNARPVLRGVSLVLGRGETLALTGESGSGKSTLLHLAGALDSFESGEITVAGTALSNLGDTGRAGLRRSVVALVFQQFNLIPSLDVAQNLAFHARLGGVSDPDWLALLTDRLGLAEFTARYPEQLSGGQQQRVAIGRAMALRPPLLWADEPTGIWINPR